MYYKSRTDLNVAQRPNPAPTMGPAGSIITDPNFGSEIIRATDENTLMLGNKPSSFCAAGLGGSADVNTWNTDSTMLYVEDSGGGGAILSFDPVSFAVERIFPDWRPLGQVLFSKLDPNICFNLTDTQFYRYDLSNRSLSMPPNPVLICDFATQLPAEPTTWQSIGGVEGADQVFTAAFSTTGSQGTGIYVCAFQIGLGYRLYNTQTGEITGDFGQVGTVSIPDRITVHNVKASKDGGWLVIQKTTQLSGSDRGPFFWDIDTLTVESVGTVAIGGHWTAGYEEFLNNDSNAQLKIPYWAHCRRSLLNMSNPSAIANPSPTPTLMVTLDDHVSFNGPQNSVLISISAGLGKKVPFPAAWYDEILGFDLSGNGLVYRFCHTFTSGTSGNFYSDNAIGCVDQLNKFVAFTSDWMQSLKSGRGDVFIVPLK